MRSVSRRLGCLALAGAMAAGLPGCAAIATQAALGLVSPEMFATMIGDVEVRSEFREAAPFIKARDWLGLTVLARQKLALNPKRGQWWQIAGYGHLQLNENALARDCFEQAVRLNPEEGGAWNLYAFALKNLGDNRRGLEAVQRSLQIDPSSGTAYVILGDLRREGGQSSEALLAYNRALEIDRADVFAWYGIGLIGKRTRDAALYEKAKKALEQIYKPMAEQLEKT
ncbi:MAG: lipoprotein NlpI [Betaproteobacteria bacterium]|nr:lipoprotein NlpI [Betaproteobacteria bacterium]